MTDPGLSKLLNWAVRNSANDDADPTAQGAPAPEPARGLDQDALRALMGGPSDADRMKEAMAAIQSADVDLENKLIAFDNFEQLVEGIDNANNMENLGLWVPLVKELDNPVTDLRRMAAWCIGTAVQNNSRAQGRALALGAIPRLVSLAIEDEAPATRKKAVFALSSEVRNYQAGLDEAIKHLPEKYRGTGAVDALDMEAVDTIINKLRENAAAK